MNDQFNLIAQLQLQAPANLGAIKSQIQRELSGITANINLGTGGLGGRGGIGGLDFAGIESGARRVQRAMSDINNSSATLQRGLGAVNASSTTLSRTLSIQERQMRANADAVTAFGYQSGLAARRFLAFATSAGVFIKLTSEIRKATSAGIDFNQQLVRLRQVSGDTPRQVDEIANAVDRLSTGLGVSSDKLSKTSVTLKQAGYTLREVKVLLDDLAATELAPNFEGLEQTTEGVIAIMSQFETPANRMRESLGAINAVAGSFAVEAGDLISVIRQAGGAFKGTGGDLNELLATFTAVRATTRESAEQIGTGLRTIFTRLQRKETVDALADLGIQMRYTRQEAEALGDSSLQQQFVGTYEGIRRISAGLAELRTTDPRYASILEELGGYRQISRVIPLLQQFGTAQKALNTARNGQVSLDIAQEQAQDALANKIAKVNESFLSLFRTLTEDKTVKNYIDNILSLTNAIIGLTENMVPLVPYLALLGTFKLAPSVGGLASNFSRGAFRTGSKFADGGLVPGSGSTDTVPAILPHGSFVIRRQAVNVLGAENLRQLDKSAQSGIDAMVTPGEYVFGPRAAKRLGNLLPMLNHAEKFSGGGPVGRVQHFTDGGPVGKYVTTSFSNIAENEQVTAASFKLFNASVNATAQRLGNLADVISGAVKVVAELVPTGKGGKNLEARFIGLEGFEGQSVNVTTARRGNVNRQKAAEGESTELFANSPRSAEQILRDLKSEYGKADASDEDFLKFLDTEERSRAKVSKGGVSEEVAARVDESVKAALEQVGKEAKPVKTSRGLGGFVRRNKTETAQQGSGSGQPYTPTAFPAKEAVAAVVSEVLADNSQEPPKGPKPTATAAPDPGDDDSKKAFNYAALGYGLKSGNRTATSGGNARSNAGTLASQPAAEPSAIGYGLQGGAGVPQNVQYNPSTLGSKKPEAVVPPSAIGFAVQGGTSVPQNVAYNPSTLGSVAPAPEPGPRTQNQLLGGFGPGRVSHPDPVKPAELRLQTPEEQHQEYIQRISLTEERAEALFRKYNPRPTLREPGNRYTPIPEDNELRLATPAEHERERLDRVNRQGVLGYVKQASRAQPSGLDQGMQAELQRQQRANQDLYELIHGSPATATLPSQSELEAYYREPGRNRSTDDYGIRLGTQSTTKSLEGVISQRLEDELLKKYGNDRHQISEQTRQENYARVTSQVNKEFVDAQTRYISAVNSNIDAEEAKRIATEQLTKATRQLAETGKSGLSVQQADSGRVLGETDTVRRADALNKSVGIPSRSSSRDIFSIVNERTEAALRNQFGGASSQVSEQTRMEFTMREEARVRAEFIAAERRAIRALNQSLDAEEANRIATERYTEAKARAAQGLDSELNVAERGGGIVGSAEVVEAARERGTSVPGGGFFGTVGRGVQNAGDRYARANARFGRTTIGRGLSNAFGGPAAIGVAIGAPLLAQQIQGLGGDVNEAARGNAVGYRASQATSGTLQSGVLGATLGFATGGPIGAAVGGVGGALFGLVSSLRDAEKEIRQARIGDAIEGFVDNFNRLRGGNTSVVTSNAIRDELSAYRANANERARSESSGFLGLGRVDLPSFVNAQRRSLRTDLGTRLPEFSQVISDSGQSAVNDNPGKSVDDLLKIVREGNNGLNDEFIGLIAAIRNVPLAEVLGEIRQELSGFQKSLEVANKVRAGEDVNVKTTNSLTRMVQAVELATKAVADLQRGIESRDAFFTGSVQSSGVSLGQLSQNSFGAGQNEPSAFFSRLEQITGQGNQFSQTAKAVDDVAKALPSALAEASRTGGADPESVTTRLEDILRKSLNVTGSTSPELRSVINSVVGAAAGQLDKDGSGEFSRSVGRDSTAVAQQLLGDISDPLIQAGNAAASKLTEAFNGILGGTARSFQQESVIRDTRGRTDDISLERTLSRADFSRSRGQVSLRALEAPYVNRLSRLTGGRFDANDISARLGQNLREQDARRSAIEANPADIQAQAELSGLQNEANKLSSALQQLTDVSSRGVGVREKLNQLEEERSGRFNLAERAVLGGPQEQLQLQRGLALVSQLDQSSNLREYSSSDRNLVASTLRTLGGAEIQGKGRADELYRKLIENTAGIATLSPQKDAARQTLEGRLDIYFAEAEKASSRLGDLYESEHQTFISELKSVIAEIPNSLKDAFQRNQQTDLENRRNAQTINLGRLEEQDKSRERLAQYGIDASNIDSANQSKGDIKAYVELQKELKSIQDKNSVSPDLAASIFSDAATDGKIRSYTSEGGSGLGKKEISTIQQGLLDAGKTPEFAQGLTDSIQYAPEDIGLEEFRQWVDAFTRDYQPGVTGDIQAEINTSKSNLIGNGINPGLLGPLSNDTTLSTFENDISQFKDSGAFSSLSEEMKSTTESIRTLEEQIKSLGKAAEERPSESSGSGDKKPLFDLDLVYKSGGGSIFKPVGTDTVPAMLTPDEYVINAKQARANFGLLEEINNSNGPVYLAGGGPAIPNELSRIIRKYGRQLNNDGLLEALIGFVSGGGSVAGAASGYLSTQNAKSAGTRADQRKAIGAARDRFNQQSQGAAAASLFQRQLFASSLFPSRAIDESLASQQDFYSSRRFSPLLFSRGGSVPGASTKSGGARRFAAGGPVSGGSSGGPAMDFSGLASSLSGFSSSAAMLSQAMNVFAGNSSALVEALNAMPRTIQMQGQHSVTIAVEGAEVLQSLMPQIEQMVISKAQNALTKMFREKMPDANIN